MYPLFLTFPHSPLRGFPFMETPATCILSHLHLSTPLHTAILSHQTRHDGLPVPPFIFHSLPTQIHSLYSDQHQLVWRYTGSPTSHLSPLCSLVTSEKLKLLNVPVGLAPVYHFSWLAFACTEALRRGPKCTHFIWTVIPGKTREEPGGETGPGGKAGKRELPGGLSLRETEEHPPWASGSHSRTGLWRRPLGDLPTPFLHRPLSVIPEHEPCCTTASRVLLPEK